MVQIPESVEDISHPNDCRPFRKFRICPVGREWPACRQRDQSGGETRTEDNEKMEERFASGNACLPACAEQVEGPSQVGGE